MEKCMRFKNVPGPGTFLSGPLVKKSGPHRNICGPLFQQNGLFWSGVLHSPFTKIRCNQKITHARVTRARSAARDKVWRWSAPCLGPYG